jgi:hypothetical protein
MNREVLYEVAVRNNYHIPKETSAFCTMKYLSAVLRRDVFAPEKHDIKLGACPRLPSQNEVIDAVRELQRTKNINFGLKDKPPYPPIDWMMDILSTYVPDHKFFKRDYFPEPKASKKKNRAELDNQHGVFDGMPDFLLKLPMKRQSGKKCFLKNPPVAIP